MRGQKNFAIATMSLSLIRHIKIHAEKSFVWFPWASGAKKPYTQWEDNETCGSLFQIWGEADLDGVNLVVVGLHIDMMIYIKKKREKRSVFCLMTRQKCKI
ncbi:unnamed protein product [Meganyctiphanes norvegica]|uniref:Uncharacterized protein n=1 Tax=Meganyctiphanes norvegica TaxID=48144 RepID=A0AAV2PKN4_MEGNR